MTTWKGYPCKDCLLKKRCSNRCFELSQKDAYDVIKYRDLNKIPDGICLGCGGVIADLFPPKISIEIPISCYRCWDYYIFIEINMRDYEERSNHGR